MRRRKKRHEMPPSYVHVGRPRTEPLRPPIPTCKVCCNLPWHRDPEGCSGCGRPYADEVVEAPTLRGQSPIAACEGVG